MANGGQGYGTRQQRHREAGKVRTSGSHLNILDPVPISIIITLVPHTVVISIFLPRVGCQKAVVLKVKGRKWMDEFCPTLAWGALSCSLARLPPAPACSVCCCPCRAAPGPGSHQCLCRVHTHSRFQPSPRYTGATQRVEVSGLGWLPTTHPLQALFSPTSFWARAHLPFPCEPPHQSLNMVTHTPLFFQAPGLAHQAGHCTIAFKETVRVDMAGAVGRAVAGPGWEAALALVAQEAQATGTTLERTLRVGRQCLRKEGQPTITSNIPIP